jgi:hypothetical protein
LCVQRSSDVTDAQRLAYGVKETERSNVR